MRAHLEVVWLTGVSVSGPRTHGRLLATLFVLVAAGIASFGVGLSVDGDAASERVAIAPTAASTARPRGPPVANATHEPTRSRVPAATSPRFVWVPEPGAVRYRVALYRDERLIFERDVTKPTLVLSSTWTHDGRFQRLTRGPYRWVVWALVRKGDFLRRGRAIVSARYFAP